MNLLLNRVVELVRGGGRPARLSNGIQFFMTEKNTKFQGYIFKIYIYIFGKQATTFKTGKLNCDTLINLVLCNETE